MGRAEDTRTEADLRESEERYRRLVESAPEGIVVHCEDKIVLGNSASVKLLGARDAEDLLGRSMLGRVHPDSRPAAAERIRKALSGEEWPALVEQRFLTLDGRTLDVEVVSTPIQWHGLPAMQVLFRDIGERRKKDEELWRSQVIVATSSDALALLDREYTYLFANPAYLRLFRKTPQEVIGCTVEDVVGEARFRDVIKPHADTCLAGSEVHYQDWIDFPYQGRVFMDVRYRPYRDADGEVAGFTVSARDITERQRTEDQLRESEAKFRSLAENSRDYIMRFDRMARPMYMNPAAQRFTGISEEALADLAMSDVSYDPEKVAAWQEKIGEVITTGEPSESLIHMEGPDGMVYLDWRLFPELDDDGHLVSVLGISRDITIQTKVDQTRLDLERRAQQGQKLESLGVLAGGIAHDFNNILTAIVGYSEVALVDLPEGHPARAALMEIRIGSDRAAALTRQMLTYAGRGPVSVESMDLAEQVNDMMHLLRASVPRTIALDVDLERDLPPIEADAGQMQQLILNLVANAAEAIGDQAGTVSVTTGQRRCDAEFLSRDDVVSGDHEADALPPGLYMYLDVSDTGCGMDDATAAKFFEPFFTTKFTGRGLGMAAVLGIVRAHKGFLTLDTAVDEGTRFRVFFPVSLTGVADAPASKFVGQPSTSGSGLVLVVDDEEPVRTVAAAMLTHSGFEVLTANDGAEAIEIFRARSSEIAIVLLDMAMPVLGGRECLDVLRQVRKDAKVILMSGLPTEESETHPNNEEPDAFLQKPFDMAALTETVTGVLEPV